MDRFSCPASSFLAGRRKEIEGGGTALVDSRPVVRAEACCGTNGFPAPEDRVDRGQLPAARDVGGCLRCDPIPQWSFHLVVQSAHRIDLDRRNVPGAYRPNCSPRTEVTDLSRRVHSEHDCREWPVLSIHWRTFRVASSQGPRQSAKGVWGRVLIHDRARPGRAVSSNLAGSVSATQDRSNGGERPAPDNAIDTGSARERTHGYWCFKDRRMVIGV